LIDLILIFFCSLENLGDLSHISELHTLLRKPSHTHALHELSLLLKKSCLREFYAHWLLNSFLYVCVFLTSYLTVFLGLDTCVCRSFVEDLTLFFSLILVLLWSFTNTLFTLCHCVKKKGSIFWFILVFRPGMYFQTSQVFLSQNGQRGSLLVFYIGYILDSQKHFMKWLWINRMVGYQFKIFMYPDSVQIKACDWSQASRRCPWKFLANSKPNQSVPVQPLGRAFEDVRTPRSVQQIMLKTSGRQSNTIRMLGKSVFNIELDFISRHC